jgi:hypothetical protein
MMEGWTVTEWHSAAKRPFHECQELMIRPTAQGRFPKTSGSSAYSANPIKLRKVRYFFYAADVVDLEFDLPS